MHRTQTVDYGLVLEGEITLVLDQEEVLMRTGDFVVERGTNHAWANRSSKPCRILFVLIDGCFDPQIAQHFSTQPQGHGAAVSPRPTGGKSA